MNKRIKETDNVWLSEMICGIVSAICIVGYAIYLEAWVLIPFGALIIAIMVLMNQNRNIVKREIDIAERMDKIANLSEELRISSDNIKAGMRLYDTLNGTITHKKFKIIKRHCARIDGCYFRLAQSLERIDDPKINAIISQVHKMRLAMQIYPFNCVANSAKIDAYIGTNETLTTEKLKEILGANRPYFLDDNN